jgi:hypothetical protein
MSNEQNNNNGLSEENEELKNTLLSLREEYKRLLFTTRELCHSFLRKDYIENENGGEWKTYLEENIRETLTQMCDKMNGYQTTQMCLDKEIDDLKKQNSFLLNLVSVSFPEVAQEIMQQQEEQRSRTPVLDPKILKDAIDKANSLKQKVES